MLYLPASHSLASCMYITKTDDDILSDVRLFGEPAAAVLPAFMQGINITEDDVQRVETLLFKEDGSLNAQGLLQALNVDLQNTSDTLQSLLMEGGTPEDEVRQLEEKELFLADAVAKVEDIVADGMDSCPGGCSDSEESNGSMKKAQSHAETKVMYRKGWRMVSREHIWERGYDLNQFGREWDCETGEFCDGHSVNWMPEAQQALFRAARHGESCPQKLAALVDQGASVNAYDPCANFVTALHWAAWRGHHRTCAVLCDLGANVSALASCGSSALHLSAFWGHVKVSQVLVRCGCPLWHRRRIDNRTALDLALRVTNARGDRTRVIVFLRQLMNLTNVAYHSMEPAEPHSLRPSQESDSHDLCPEAHGCGITELKDDEDSEELLTDGLYEWQGPPGNEVFPELGHGHDVRGQWVRTNKPNVPSRPKLCLDTQTVGGGGPDEEVDMTDVYVTLPAGPYVAPWLLQEGEPDAAGQGWDGFGHAPANARDYLVAAKEEEAAARQELAEAVHQTEFNTTVASAAVSSGMVDAVLDANAGWAERNIRGSGTEYGRNSMQSKSMRGLGLHRKDDF